ncbi:MAG: hypothetical protein Fur0022_31160 [Anaerolineales bacterium]
MDVEGGRGDRRVGGGAAATHTVKLGGWTREEAIQYIVETLGWGRQSATAEVDRYLAWPGQATAYKIGMLKILALRQRAMDALGEDFDIIEFHNLVVGNGAMPLGVLEWAVDGWIEKTRGN